MPAIPIRRRAMTRAETLAILSGQGADLTTLILPKGALREKQIWTIIEAAKLTVPCGNCAGAIVKRADCVRDHKIRLRSAPGGRFAEYDQAWNQWYLCLHCNTLKTSQRGLTGLGSDAALIAKLRRVEKKAEEKPCRPKAKITSRPFPKGQRFPAGVSRPIPSRPFPKRKKPTIGEK